MTGVQGLVTDAKRAATDLVRRMRSFAAPLPFAVDVVRPEGTVTVGRFRSEAEALVCWRHVHAAFAAVRETPVVRVELHERGALRRVIQRHLSLSHAHKGH